MKILELTKDLASIASNIYANSWKVAYTGIVPQKYLNELSPERWTPILENTKHKCFMLQDNGIFVATSSIVTARDKNYSDYGEIASIYVLPEYFRKGYGKKLFEFMTEKLRSEGYKKIYLWVLEENLNARRFYEKMGFRPNGDKKLCRIACKDLIEVCYTNVNL